MKRYVAFILSVIIIIGCTTISVFADTDTQEEYQRLDSNSVIFTAFYTNDAKQIEINGNVNYNVLVSYGKYSIGILRVAAAESISDAVLSKEPEIVAEMNIAAKFAFSFKVETTADRFSKYAVVLISPQREIVLASEPQLVSVGSKYSSSQNDKSEFKGIMPLNMADVSISGDLGFGSVIIPVYYNRLINESLNGYMYPHEDGHCFFDKTYIDELDVKVRTYSSIGARVYLQLLLPVDSANRDSNPPLDTKYLMPDVYNAETIATVYTGVKFLASRYNDYSSGRVGGIVVGSQIDRGEYNYNGGLDIEKYSEKYAYYLAVVANTARLVNSDIDIVVPISNFNSYSQNTAPKSGYSPSVLVERISEYLDSIITNGIDCSIMIDSEDTPIKSYVNEDGEEYFISSDSPEDRVGVNNFLVVESFFSRLRSKYKSAPKNYIYHWRIDKELSGNILESAYVYSYYSLINIGRVSSFVVSFNADDTKAIESISNTLGKIDTSDGKTITAQLLPFFGVDSWINIIDNYSEKFLDIRNEFSPDGPSIELDYIGSFNYFDFSTGDLLNWYDGAYSNGVRLDYGEGGERVLKQNAESAYGRVHSDLFYLWDFGENLTYTPAVKFSMSVTDGEVSTGAVYEVTVTIGTDGNSISKSEIVRSGEIFDIWLDVAEFSKENKARYIKISTRNITGDSSDYALWLYDVVGYSAKYDSAALSELINAERQNIRNQQGDNNNGIEDWIYWIVFSIIMLAVFTGGVILLVLRREDGIEARKRKNNDKN